MLQVSRTNNTFRADGATIFRVVQQKSVRFEEVLARMSAGSSLNERSSQLVLDRFVETLGELLADGNQVHTPLGVFSVGLHWSKVRSDETAAPKKVFLRVRTKPSFMKQLKNEIRISVVDAPPLKCPVIEGIENAEQRVSADTYRTGDILHLTGARLSFPSADPESGVFFVDEKGTEVRAPVFVRIGSNHIDLKVPELAAGSYTLKVRTRPHKSLRSGTYAGAFVVGQPQGATL